MDLDDIFLQSYLKDYAQREKQKIIHNKEDRAIATEKKKKIEIIEKFLQKFVDLEVIVNHKDQYTKNTSSLSSIEPQKFKFYLVDSSKTWSPGISIFFDHPCEVEIAIPNKPIDEGVVVIKVASHHPDSYMLEQKFNNFEGACKALARFLSKNTVKISKDPRKYVRENLQKINNQNETENPKKNKYVENLNKISSFFSNNIDKENNEQ